MTDPSGSSAKLAETISYQFEFRTNFIGGSTLDGEQSVFEPVRDTDGCVAHMHKKGPP